MRNALFAFILFSFAVPIKTSFAEKPDITKKPKEKEEIEISLDQDESAPLVKKTVRDLSSSKKKKRRKGRKHRTKGSKGDFRAAADEELEDTAIPSLEDSLGDTKDLKAQLLQELEDEHHVGSKDQGLKTYFEAKSIEGQKKFDFQDMELQVIGRHSERISGKKFRRDISSGDEVPTDKKKALKRKKKR